jgi:hypothetical protein
MARLLEMPDVRSNDQDESKEGRFGKVPDPSVLDDDILMETILENIHTTPIGQVLKRIGELPEIRRGKVMTLRRRLDEGSYDLDDRLDAVLDRVLEDLTVRPTHRPYPHRSSGD